MSGHEYDYGDDFVEVRRGGQAGRAPYGAEHDLDRDLLLAGLRRERADSVTFTPQDSFGRTTHSEAGDSGDDQAYFSTKHQQFESSFRGIRRRERAPLAPRMWDMRRISGAEEPSAASDAPAGATYDSEVELRELPAKQQELAIIEDVLSLLIGVSGRYISFRHPAHAKVWRSPLAVDEALLAPMWISPTLAQMANKVLPLVLMHRRVEYFSSVYARREAGLVNQALCAAITSVLRDYHTSISTLENLERTSTATSPYTLQQLWYHLYPHMQTLERLMHLIDAIQAKDLPSATKAAASDDTPRESEGFTTAADRRMGVAPDAAHLPDGDGMAAPAPTRAERSGIGSNGAGPMSGDDADADSLAESDASDSEAEPSELFIVRGGHTLNIISDLIRLRGGDAAARQLYEFLLAKASVPFLQMLAYWLRTGELEDSRSAHPGGEFMVASDNGAAAGKSLVGAEASDDDLADESTIRPRLTGFVSVPELTPAFLRPYAEKIVRTGEYLNILRAYGVDLRALGGSDIQLPEAAAGLNSLQNPQALTRQIDEAYLRANQALLDVLFQGGQMMAYMGAVKRYLLFETSDFLTHFLDLAKVEITRQPKDMSSSRLQSFLDLALLNPASVSHDDPLRDIVRVTMESVDLVETMRVINTGHGGSANTSALLAARRLTREAAGATFLGTSIIGDDFLTGDLFMALQLQIPFPFTVVLDREALDKYTAMSRLLLALKQTEQALVTSWTLDLRLDDPPVEATGATGMDAKIAAARRALFLRIHTVRHRMVMAIQQILFYCFWDVIEPQWTRMIALMKAATTVDELCRIHKQHLDLMFQQCGLTAPKLPKITVELLMRASKFLSFVSKVTTAKSALLRDTGSAAAQRTAAGRLRDDLVRDTADPETQYAQLLAAAKHADRLDRYWNEQLKVLLGALNHYARKFEESYLALAVRLDCYRGDDGATAR